jgi:ATP-dependent DNA helicase RecQ
LLSLVQRLSGRFGRKRLAALATTHEEDQFASIPERGMLADQTQAYVMELFRALEAGGLVEASGGEYPTIHLTPAGREVVSGTRPVALLSLRLPSAKEPRVKRSARASSPVLPMSEEDHAVREQLRALRMRLAKEGGQPAYTIFDNRTLDEITQRKPRTADELLAVPGIGPARLERYGDAILSLFSN